MTAPKNANHHHRSTLSQSNKPFKARHATKGSLKQAAKGKVNKESSKLDRLKPKASLSIAGQKAARKNHAKQLQANKAQARARAQGVFAGPNPAPRVIAILGLSADVDPLTDVLQPFRAAAGLTDPLDCTQSTTTFVWPSPNRAPAGLLQFVLLPHNTPLGQVLSAVTGADFLVCALSANEECTAWGETTLRAIQALGGSTLASVGLVCHLASLDAPKDVQRTRESLASFLRYFFPQSLLLNRMVSADASDEIAGAVRSMLAKKPAAGADGRPVGWREGRGRLVAEEIAWADETLKVTGHVRGGRFSANRLVHVPFLGDYRLSMITFGEQNQVASARIDDEADELMSENCPSAGDELMAEQTWPTEEEIASAPANQQVQKTKNKPRRVPVGTSEYQAAWIVDIDGDEEEKEEMETDEIELDQQGSDRGEGHVDEEEEEMEDLQVSEQAGSSKEVRFMDLSEEAEQADLAQYRADRQRQRDRAKEDEEFPDEMDTPLDVPARQRFARYRGMKSMRTSEWDPFENLPAEYGKVFGFEGWKSMGKKLSQRANEQEAGVGPGMRVTLHLEQFSRADFESLPSTLPLVVFSLLKHEHKYSVMHFTTQRNTEFESDLKSKDALIVCVGFRFFKAQPIWSQPSVRGTNNVHKFERYLRPGRMSVGTAYMPVTFGATTPVVVLQEQDDGAVAFVGSGTLVGSEPQRIIAKRLILTGHPYKVHKKTATIRYMFFNREDIDYFKPIELKTKKGKTGHIKEALGTHGYFKAGFDSMIDQMDTVCLALYKRCFPKWAVGWRGTTVEKSGEEMDVDQMA